MKIMNAVRKQQRLDYLLIMKLTKDMLWQPILIHVIELIIILFYLKKIITKEVTGM